MTGRLSDWSRWLACAVLALFVSAVGMSCAQVRALVVVLPSQVPIVLPMNPQAAQAQWTVVGELRLVDGPILGRKVYEVPAGQLLELRSTTALSGAYVVEGLVRFPAFSQGAQGRATLECGLTEKDGIRSAACRLEVACYARSGYTATARLSPEALGLVAREGEPPPQPRVSSVSASERFTADRVSPVWPEQFRIEVENGMAKLTPGNELWRRLRIEVRPRSVRVYQNGVLVAEDPGFRQADGQVALSVAGEARVAALEAHTLDLEDGPYVTVPLESVCNASGPVNASSLPPPGQRLLVQDVPFVFPARDNRTDHVDIGESLFRYRMDEGYAAEPNTTWPAPTQLDPARIMLRVPKYAYQRAWIMAASDGEPNSAPVLTIRFFRAYKGWALDSAVRVPEFTARTGQKDARRVEVRMKDGTKGSLWLLPVDIDPFWLASDFREEEVLNVELTKEVKDWRMFPDPCQYDSFQAGLPSAVRLYGLTLEKAPVSVIASSDRAGNLYTDPEKPVWVVSATNQSGRALRAGVTLEVSGPDDATSTYRGTTAIPAGGAGQLRFEPEMHKYGLYKVLTTVACEDSVQSREGALLLLPPDRRKADAKTSPWGLFCWGGGHSTNPNPEDNLRLLTALGNKTGSGLPYEKRKNWGMGPPPVLAYFAVPPFAKKDPYDPAEYAAFADEFGKIVAKTRETIPDLEYVEIFAEHLVSMRLTAGPPSHAWGEPWWTYTEEEKESIRSHLVGAMAAFEGTRKHAPGVKFLFGHCGPMFCFPFLRENFPKEFFDGFGVDSPQFERMPERPPRAVEVNLLYFVREELKRCGYEDKELVHTESYYPSSHRLALGHRQAADSVVRTAVLGLAFGSDKFLQSWTLHDCEDYWGSQHYGCLGLISRRPEYNPKPAAAAFATMTQVLDLANYDGYLPTGSRTAYCVRFKAPDRLVYCLWTIRGSRLATLEASAASNLVMVDENGNETPLQLVGGRAQLTVAPTPVWVVARGGQLQKVEVGVPTYTEAPGPHRRVLDGFEKADWTYDPGASALFEGNNWDVRRTPGPMKLASAKSAERRSKVWQISLTQAPADKPFVGWYGVLSPPGPVVIPGKARALGVWVNGNSGWGRIVYELVDAKGETYLSCGTKDDWNCDDVHSWSYFNFDGWRYVEFPLPSNSSGDCYREKDNVWWGHSAEGVVDLPLRLTKVIFEMPGYQLYVDDIVPVENLTVEVDDLMAVYDSAEMMTDLPVKVQRAAAEAATPLKGEGRILPDTYGELTRNGVGTPAKIVRFYPPEQWYDGTRVHVSIQPVEGAGEYQVWVSAYPDGRGAQTLLKTAQTEPLVSGLKADFPLHFFVTYTDAEGKTSRPSALRRTVLRDEFPMK